jgi:hypothetical protein
MIAGEIIRGIPLPALRDLFDDVCGKEDDRLNEFQDPTYRNPDQAEGEEQEPDKRVQDEGQKSQWPAQNQEDAPEEKFDHIFSDPVDF